MGWFTEQIRERIRRDEEDLSDAMEEIGSIITRSRPEHGAVNREEEQEACLTDAICQVLRYYRIKPAELPPDIQGLEDKLEHLCRPCGIMHRTVKLEKGWYRDSVGAMLGFRKDGRAVALIPGKICGYFCYHISEGTPVRITKKTEMDLEEEAICFYKPFPVKRMGLRDLVRYMLEAVPMSSYLMLIGMMVLTTLVGTVFPHVTHAIYNQVIPSQSMRLFWAVLIFSVSVQVGNLLIGMVKTLAGEKVSTQMRVAVQAATMARVMSLPAEFFKKYSAGELSVKIQQFHALSDGLYSSFISTGLTAIFSLIYMCDCFFSSGSSKSIFSLAFPLSFKTARSDAKSAIFRAGRPCWRTPKKSPGPLNSKSFSEISKPFELLTIICILSLISLLKSSQNNMQ